MKKPRQKQNTLPGPSTNINRLTAITCFLFLFLPLTRLTPLEDDKNKSMETTWTSLYQSENRENTCIPSLAHRFPTGNMETAYRVRDRLVRKRLDGQPTPGFKAGLTSTNSRKRFGAKEPVTGVFLPYKQPKDRVILKKDFRRLMIETEIGFIIGKEITRPLANEEELKKHISMVMPVVELPDLCIKDPEKLKLLDIIVGNVSAGAFLTGKPTPLTDATFDPDSITVTLKRKGETINQGKGADAMEGQWKAALWLVNHLTRYGRQIQRGQFIITGALGKMIEGKEGKYTAEYGPLGRIEFSIR